MRFCCCRSIFWCVPLDTRTLLTKHSEKLGWDCRFEELSFCFYFGMNNMAGNSALKSSSFCVNIFQATSYATLKKACAIFHSFSCQKNIFWGCFSLGGFSINSCTFAGWARAESFHVFSLLGGTFDHSYRSSMYEVGNFPAGGVGVWIGVLRCGPETTSKEAGWT